jgi:hypothetical protein
MNLRASSWFSCHGFLSMPKTSEVWIKDGFGINFEFLAVDIRIIAVII